MNWLFILRLRLCVRGDSASTQNPIPDRVRVRPIGANLDFDYKKG
jgi:hypothetical protein